MILPHASAGPDSSSVLEREANVLREEDGTALGSDEIDVAAGRLRLEPDPHGDTIALAAAR